MMDWVYTSSTKKPQENEIVLCDMGKDFDFAVMKYSNDNFYDVHIGEYYSYGQIRRWASIGKHWNEQF